MTPESLVKTVEDFLAGSRGAVVMEDGAVAFDLEQAKYSISGERNNRLLHLWSAERNVVRRVLEAEVRHETLRLAVQRMGQTKPTRLEICGVRQPSRRPRAWLTGECSNIFSSAGFPDSPLVISAQQWIWNVPSVQFTRVDYCAADNPDSQS